MNGLGTLLIIGIVLYFLFSKKGGMGCCGGHSHHSSRDREPERRKPHSFHHKPEHEDIIDLKPDEYKVISESSK